VHLPPASVAPADQLQDWQLHVQDVEEQGYVVKPSLLSAELVPKMSKPYRRKP
jgi:hypothetical protein